MINTTLFTACFYVYTLALLAAIVALTSSKRWPSRVAQGLFITGFALHTVALLVRWAEAGDVEVAAFEGAEGRILAGWEWFKVWTSHPPWSNLYESLVCFGWGASLVALVGMRRFKVPVLPVLAIGLSMVVMGAASLLINQQISPLVPALQSTWLHLHVATAIFSYPAFGLAAMLGFLYLVKDGVPSETFGAVAAATALLIILAVGGASLILQAEYTLTPLVEHMGKLMPLTYAAQDAEGQTLVSNARLRVPVAGMGPVLMLAALTFLGALVVYAFTRKRPEMVPLFRWMLLGATALLTAALLILVGTVVVNGSLDLDSQQAATRVALNHMGGDGRTLVANFQLHGRGPFVLSLKGNPFEFMLLVVAWIGALGSWVLGLKRDWLETQLPAAERLDEGSYKTILFAFPFMTLLIITGAIWAYYAWGRYWGWDPKETWSLITWIVYSIYLHVRLTHGWEGRLPAALAVAGFGVVIFTYLGVNILISGLHSYAAG